MHKESVSVTSTLMMTSSLQYMKMKTHFDTNVNKGQYYMDWTTATFTVICRENPGTKTQEMRKMLVNNLQLCERDWEGPFQAIISYE